MSGAVVLVCGGRHYDDAAKVWLTLDALHRAGIGKVVHGGSNGADALAKAWAEARDVECVEHVAHWDKHGRAAGPIRNQAMLDLEEPDLVLAFPGGSGTLDMVTRAEKAHIAVVMVRR